MAAKTLMLTGVIGLCLAALGAQASTNVALSADGATFVSGSSFINVPGYSETIAEANLLTTTPTPAYSNGDTRYIFGGGQNSVQTLEIDLGAERNLSSFAATFGATDRTPTGLTVFTSTDGVTFNQVAAPFVTADAGSEYIVSAPSVLTAQYVIYSFGGPSPQYGYGGSGISELFASVPEPATWSLMILGVAAIGGALRLDGRRRTSVAC